MPEPLAPTPEFLALADSAGLTFDAGDLERFGAYLALLLDANTRFNLTAVRDPAQAWVRHVLDSLTLLPLIGEAAEARVAEATGPMQLVDVGSGGGAPGLILALVLPEWRITLVESTGKKAKFLEETARALSLGNVEVVCERAEVMGQDRDKFRDRFDVATARAVGSVAEAAELTIPLLRVGGLSLLTKGQRTEEELRDAKAGLHMLHAGLAGVVETPTGKIVVLEKRRPTPRVYPRRPGEPKRAPLGVGKRADAGAAGSGGADGPEPTGADD